jgi:hypothetical protein
MNLIKTIWTHVVELVTTAWQSTQAHYYRYFDYAQSSELVVGDQVRFKQKVFAKPYSPYYDAYRGHTFIIEKIVTSTEDDEEVEAIVTDSSLTQHIKLRNKDAMGVNPKGYVHPDEVELVHGDT